MSEMRGRSALIIPWTLKGKQRIIISNSMPSLSSVFVERGDGSVKINRLFK